MTQLNSEFVRSYGLLEADHAQIMQKTKTMGDKI